MRELTIRIRFTRHCLGNVKARGKSGRFLFARSPGGSVIFLPTWHQSNMRFAARVVGKHQDEVAKILWDMEVDGVVKRGEESWYKRYYSAMQYCLHESFVPGQIVGINCVVPEVISDDDVWRLMQVAGQYKGLSPWKPTDFGLYAVESIRPRRVVVATACRSEEKLEGVNTKGL